MSPLVSVVIPVYNAMPYLVECLDSVCNQTLDDIEIICVDDGSTDASRATLESRASTDMRIKIIDGGGEASNGGTSRNLGLDNSSGEYVVFLDADDYFEPDMLELAYNSAIKNDSDVVLFDGEKFDHQTNEIIKDYEVLRTKYVPDSDVFSAQDVAKHIFQITNPTPWSQLYRRDYLLEEEIRFQSLPNTNDAYMTFAALASAKRISVVDKVLVHYRSNTHSSTQDGKWRYPFCFLEAFSMLEDRLINENLYDDFKASFIEGALRHAKFNLNSQRNYASRLDVMDAIENGEYLKTDILTANAEGLSKRAKNLAATINSAIGQRRFLEHLNDDADTKVDIVESRCNSGSEPVLSIISINENPDSPGNAYKEILKDIDLPVEIICVCSPNAESASQTNTGISAAHGEYILILDNSKIRDGLIDIDMASLAADIEVLKRYGDRGEAIDLLWIAASGISKETSIKSPDASSEPSEKIVSGKELFRTLHSTGAYDADVSNYIVRRGVLHGYDLAFREDSMRSDIDFTFKCMALSSACLARDSKTISHISGTPELDPSFNNCYGTQKGAYECQIFLEENRSEWQPEELDAALNLISDYYKLALAIYAEMPLGERGARLALPPLDEFVYRQNVIVPALEKRYKQRAEKAESAKKAKTGSRPAKTAQTDSDPAKKKSGISKIKKKLLG